MFLDSCFKALEDLPAGSGVSVLSGLAIAIEVCLVAGGGGGLGGGGVLGASALFILLFFHVKVFSRWGLVIISFFI